MHICVEKNRQKLSVTVITWWIRPSESNVTDSESHWGVLWSDFDIFIFFVSSFYSLSLSLSLSLYIYIYIYIYYCFWYFIKENITLFLLTTAISVSIFITWASKFKIRFPSAHFELPVFQVVFQFSLSKLSKSFGSCSLFSVFFCVVA